MPNIIFLSHMLDLSTPSFGNKNQLVISQKKSLCCGDNSNDSYLHISAHLGTHIDMPFHFYENGQTIEDFPDNFWYFDSPIIVEIDLSEKIIYQNLILALERLNKQKLKKCDILIVKTGMGNKRKSPSYWQENPGFSPELYAYFKRKMPALRILGFDSISLTGFQHREIGKLAHQAFLNPEAPILLIEDMKLDEIVVSEAIDYIIVSPLRIKKCDGLPCTILAIRNAKDHDKSFSFLPNHRTFA